MNLIDNKKLPVHVAVIMDGNGRWAKKQNLPRIRGHQQGAEAVKKVVEANRKLGIRWLTLYAFSEENWQRPESEIRVLMKLLKRFLKSELNRMLKNGIRLQTIGRTDKLPQDTRLMLQETIARTAHNKDMVLNLALSYGGRQEITDAVRKLGGRIEKGQLAAAEISSEQLSNCLYAADMPDPDLLIRTSGEYRISNFLLWQIAYTEIYITPTLWPDFGEDEFLAAISDFQQRERRFGSAQS